MSRFIVHARSGNAHELKVWLRELKRPLLPTHPEGNGLQRFEIARSVTLRLRSFTHYFGLSYGGALR
jgi:hypothetical protein